MFTWVFFAVVGMLFVGLMMALQKVPAAKKIDKYALSAWTYLFAAVISGIVLREYISVDSKTLLYSAIWGSGFAILTLMQMHLLHKHDTSGLFPFTSGVSNVLVVFGGVLFFNDAISLLQWLAIIASICLFVAAHWNNKVQFVAEILPAFLTVSVLSTFNKFVQKMGSSSLENHNFIFWQLTFACLASVVILMFTHKKMALTYLTRRHLFGWAIVAGALNFGSTYSIVRALSDGPISLVYVILGLYTFFATFFAALLFKERVTKKALVFVTLSTLVVFLIKFS